jgi:Domain of unknown function (DUF4395)
VKGPSDVTTSAGADRNFVLQQGLEAPDATSCGRLSSALLFQARVIGLVLMTGAILRSPILFAALGVLLWWCSLLPRLNPFDFAYNHTLGLRAGAPTLGRAPAPRRFAQGMAGTFALGTAACMAAGFWIAAWVLLAIFLLAVAALVLGRFCLGSFVYHLARGHAAFAVDTLPWGRGA